MGRGGTGSWSERSHTPFQLVEVLARVVFCLAEHPGAVETLLTDTESVGCRGIFKMFGPVKKVYELIEIPPPDDSTLGLLGCRSVCRLAVVVVKQEGGGIFTLGKSLFLDRSGCRGDHCSGLIMSGSNGLMLVSCAVYDGLY